MPVVMFANSEREIARALDLAEEFKLRAIIAGGREADRVAERLAKQNVPVFRPDEVVIDGREVPAGVHRREVDGVEVGAVREHHRDAVAGLQPDGPQGVHEPVRPLEQLAEGDLVAVGIDQRQPVRLLLRDVPEPRRVAHGVTVERRRRWTSGKPNTSRSGAVRAREL